MNSGYRLKEHLGRWIIVCEGAENYAWSGSRWVPIGAQTKICNFVTPAEAHRYACEAGIDGNEKELPSAL